MSTTQISVESLVGMRPAVIVASCHFDPDGTSWVKVPRVGMVRARTVLGVATTADLGRGNAIFAVVALEAGNPQLPIILGLLANPDEHSSPLKISSDGKKATVTADNEITLRCGKAAITLTKAGKILITGEYVLSRARGTHRIKGGTVQIN